MPPLVPGLQLLARPTTPPALLAKRQRFVQRLLSQPTAADPTYSSFSVEWSTKQVTERRDWSRTNELGCHFSTMKEDSGRARFKHHGKMLYLTSVALIADGRREQQMRCRQGGNWEVSHLCHNSMCYNPAHLVVESRELNRVSLDSPNYSDFH